MEKLDETEALTAGEMGEIEGSFRLEEMRTTMSTTDTASSSSWKNSFSRRGRKLSEEAKQFVNIVTVKDRKYHLRTWPRVFVGAEAVDAIVFAGMASTRWEAVQLGRTLARDLGLFNHVTGGHAFADEFLFYHYVNENVPKDMLWDEQSVNSMALSHEGSEHSGDTDSSHLAEQVEAFKRCADVRDRRYHGVKYKSCFIATDVVDNLVFTGIVKSRQEAVKLGRALSRELRVFHHVTNDHVFR